MPPGVHKQTREFPHPEAQAFRTSRTKGRQGPPNISWITYNNCLMESYKRGDGTEVRRVFLPTYGLPAIDRKAKELYESQGFKVLPMELPALTSWRGAIRCISNILGRQPEA